MQTPSLYAQPYTRTNTMKAISTLVATIVAIAAAHGQIEDPGVNGRRQLLGRALILSARQGDGAVPLEGPSDPGANGRKRQADSAGPYEGPINPPGGCEKKRQNGDGAGPHEGPELSGGAAKSVRRIRRPLAPSEEQSRQEGDRASKGARLASFLTA